MRGLMMDYPLTLAPLLERAERLFSKVEIVWRRPDRSVARTTYAAFYRRARRLARALTDAGLGRGDRVGTLMWNHAAHLEAYFGVPVAGSVLHTLNPRLHPDEIASIASHAGDRFLLVDESLLPIYEAIRGRVKFERVIVVRGGGVAPTGGPLPPGINDYEELIAEASDDFAYPALEENEAATMCYTSGTTGHPKGVLFSHRALVLHTLASGLCDGFGIAQRDVVLPVVPMFHVNGWGVPFTAIMTGAKLVLPGPHLDPESLLDLFEQERVTISFGVPTVWLGIAAQLEKNPGRWKLPQRVRVLCGGAAPPEGLIRALDRQGLEIVHSWGMTELTPYAAACRLRSYMENWPEEQQYGVRTLQGAPAPFLELRVMGAGGEAPRDGRTAGELEVRGPWVAASYYEAPEQAQRWTADGWFRTGDVACMDEDGYIRIVDRAKDLIKSGGEWISSVDLENALMDHPAVREAAVIGIPHPVWQERPLAVVVLKEGRRAEADELRGFLAARFAKWQLPDAIVFTGELPRTSVGKFKKSVLRERYAGQPQK
jgi:acyl-CoA synthetase (AMP-forming)/AMP-acid ligase II